MDFFCGIFGTIKCKGYCASNGEAIAHVSGEATAHQMVKLLHMKWRGYCTLSGEASVHEVERLVHMKWRGYHTSNGEAYCT